MKISVIIPTLNRISSLKETIDSINNQKMKPHEIIIVDQSDGVQIKQFVSNYKIIKYFYQKEKSSAKARNYGANQATGEVLCFLDDDVILDKNYFFNINKILQANSKIYGLTGDPYLDEKINFFILIKRYVGKIFNLFFLNDKLKPFAVNGVFGNRTYQIKPKTLCTCEWLPGHNLVVLTKIFDEFKFDNKFITYSFKEDVDFSYRIYKKYPNTLFYSPDLKLIHKQTTEYRILPNEEKIKMNWINSTYVYLKHKNINFQYYWSCIGHLIDVLIQKGIKAYLLELKCFKYTLKNIEKIKSRNINFYNWN